MRDMRSCPVFRHASEKRWTCEGDGLLRPRSTASTSRTRLLLRRQNERSRSRDRERRDPQRARDRRGSSAGTLTRVSKLSSSDSRSVRGDASARPESPTNSGGGIDALFEATHATSLVGQSVCTSRPPHPRVRRETGDVVGGRAGSVVVPRPQVLTEGGANNGPAGGLVEWWAATTWSAGRTGHTSRAPIQAAYHLFEYRTVRTPMHGSSPCDGAVAPSMNWFSGCGGRVGARGARQQPDTYQYKPRRAVVDSILSIVPLLLRTWTDAAVATWGAGRDLRHALVYRCPRPN